MFTEGELFYLEPADPESQHTSRTPHILEGHNTVVQLISTSIALLSKSDSVLGSMLLFGV